MPEATLIEGATEPGTRLSESQAIAALSRLRNPEPTKPAAPPATSPPAEPAAPDPAPPQDTAPATPEAPAQDGQDPNPDAQAQSSAAPDLATIAKYLGLSENDLVADDDGTVSLKTKVDGQEGTAKLNDLRKSYQLDSSFTHKSMELAEQRKAFEQEREAQTKAITDKRQELELGIRLAAHYLHGQYATVDWAKLQQENPIEYLSLKDQYDQHLRSIEGLYQTLQKDDQTRAQKQQQAFADWAQQQIKDIQNHIPEWKDTAKAKADLEGIFATAKKDYGMTQAELDQLIDSRHIRILKDAAAWRALQAKQPAVMAKVKTAPVLAKPGAPQAQKSPIQQAEQAFKNNPTVENAAKLLAARRKK